MIKRPISPQFVTAVLEGRKITTIRDKAWPVGVEIMLYRWEGKPYRSKQIDVAVVKVTGFWTIQIHHEANDALYFFYGAELPRRLYECEGFDSDSELCDWFRPLVPVYKVAVKKLMRFRLIRTA